MIDNNHQPPAYQAKSFHCPHCDTYANANVHVDREINIESKDNEEIVNKLFMLVNFIVEKTISDQKVIDDLLDKIPEDKKQAIKNRDSGS